MFPYLLADGLLLFFFGKEYQLQKFALVWNCALFDQIKSSLSVILVNERAIKDNISNWLLIWSLISVERRCRPFRQFAFRWGCWPRYLAKPYDYMTINRVSIEFFTIGLSDAFLSDYLTDTEQNKFRQKFSPLGFELTTSRSSILCSTTVLSHYLVVDGNHQGLYIVMLYWF